MCHPIDLKHIQIVDTIKDYQEAIKLASRPLLLEGYIEESYINAMLEAVQTYGPYIVIQDEFAMPHANPQSGVNKTGLSLLVVRSGIDLLGQNVKVFLVLAPKTKDALTEVLTFLSDFLMNKENIRTIYNAKSVESIQSLLEESW